MSTCWYLTGVVAPNRRKAKRKLAERKTAGVRRSSVLGVGKSLERVFRSVSNLVKGHTSIEKAKRASIQVATDSVYKSRVKSMHTRPSPFQQTLALMSPSNISEHHRRPNMALPGRLRY